MTFTVQAQAALPPTVRVFRSEQQRRVELPACRRLDSTARGKAKLLGCPECASNLS
jgi:hypothetical protein